MRHALRAVLVLIAVFSLSAQCGLSASAHSSTGRAVARVSAAPMAAASAKTTPKRHKAIRAAYTKEGKPYRYGGNGPNSFDCSGLVVWAYGKYGIKLPRTTGGMLKSSKLVRTSSPRWGDLVFTSSGHVEFYVHKKNGVRWMFGAHKSGTRIGYKKVYYNGGGWPKYYRVKGAG